MEPRLSLSTAGAGMPVRLEPESKTPDKKTVSARGCRDSGQPARPLGKIARRRAHLSCCHGYSCKT